MNLMQDVVVIGSGISGLACAYYLKRLGRKVLLIENTNRVGGVIQSELVDSFLIEHGPNSFQNTQLVSELIEELNLTPYLVSADNKIPRYIYYKDKLQPLPMGLSSFLSSQLLSFPAKLRLFYEPFISKSKQEETIEQFITRRLGKQVHDVLVSPFVSGIYAGDTSQLSATASSPFSKLVDLENMYGSIVRGIFSNRDKNKKNSYKICSFIEGLETLPKALQSALANEILLNCKIQNIQFQNSSTKPFFDLQVEINRQVTSIKTTSLVIAIPAFKAAQLLESLSIDLTSLLNKISYPSLIGVAFGYKKTQFSNIPNGFGVLIPRSENIRTLGCIWNSSIFPNRTPEGSVLLTSFIGGTLDPEAVSLSDNEIIQTVHQDLKKIMNIQGEPKVLRITRWKKAIPQYTLGHVEHCKKMEKIINQYPGLYLAGNYISGVSIGDCIKQAKEVVENLN